MDNFVRSSQRLRKLALRGKTGRIIYMKVKTKTREDSLDLSGRQNTLMQRHGSSSLKKNVGDAERKLGRS